MIWVDDDPNSRPLYIYALIDPSNGELFYIGSTVNVKQRVNMHMYESKKEYPLKKSRRERRIKQILDMGLRPEVKILEETVVSRWQEREDYWIRHYLANGCELENSANVVTDLSIVELSQKYRSVNEKYTELTHLVTELSKVIEGEFAYDHKERMFFLKKLIEQHKK